MARNKVVETISADELHDLQERAAQAAELSGKPFAPEKIVIVAGTSFGTALKFLLLGVAVGAAAATLWQNKNVPAAHSDAVYEGISGGGAKDASTLQARAEALLRRVKNLASRAKDAAQTVAENVKPTLQDAVEEGQNSARKTEQELRDELSRGSS